MTDIATIQQQFEDRNLTTITYKGRQCWLAHDVFAAIGYEDPKGALKDAISRWDQELDLGDDYIRITGPDLKAFKEGGILHPSSSSNTVTLFFQGGVDLVCIKTEKPAGKRLRKWLRREVFPQLRETGAYSVPDKKPALSESEFELRLIELDLRRAELEERKKQSSAESIRHIVQRARSVGHVSDDILLTVEVRAAEIVSGESLGLLLPPAPEEMQWLSPTAIGSKFGVTKNMIGRVVGPNGLGIKGDTRYSKAMISTALGHNKTVTVYLYNEKAVAMIKGYLVESGKI